METFPLDETSQKPEKGKYGKIEYKRETTPEEDKEQELVKGSSPTVKKIPEPIIFDDEEYARRLRDYNPGVDQIPHDFMRFDPTELETHLRELLHANDQWAFVQEKDTKAWEIPHVKTEKEEEIDQLMEKQDLTGNPAAYVRERMLQDSGMLQGRFDKELEELEEEGPSYTNQLKIVKELAKGTGGKPREIEPKRGDGFTTWGTKVPLGDCEVQELTIGKLHFRAIDYGGKIRLSEKNRKVLGNVGPFEKNQCVLLHAVAGTQWNRDGRRNGIPTLAKALS